MKRRGLTLIELLVTVLIIGILSAVSIPLYSNGISDARKNTATTQRKTLLNGVQLRHLRSAESYATIATSISMDGVANALPDVGTHVAPPPGCGSYVFSATVQSFTVKDDCGESKLGA
ncbi:MAG: type IV pilin protein [Fimbriimonadaceae bacterium]